MRRHVGGPPDAVAFLIGEKSGEKGWKATSESENDMRFIHSPLFSCICAAESETGSPPRKTVRRNTSLLFLSVIRNEKRCVHSSPIHPEVYSPFLRHPTYPLSFSACASHHCKCSHPLSLPPASSLSRFPSPEREGNVVPTPGVLEKKSKGRFSSVRNGRERGISQPSFHFLFAAYPKKYLFFFFGVSHVHC